jgi:Mandelate racemase / muconate lactonizing enzyme, N-terminal domain
VRALDFRGRVVRDSRRIPGLDPGGAEFGPDGRYYLTVRRQRTIRVMPAVGLGGGVTGRDAGLVVRDVMVRALVVPLRRPLATRVGDFPRWPLLLIDVSTEQGIVGRGYLAPYLNRAAAVLLPAIRDLGAGLRGRPVTPAGAREEARRWFGLAGYQGLAVAHWRTLSMDLRI